MSSPLGATQRDVNKGVDSTTTEESTSPTPERDVNRNASGEVDSLTTVDNLDDLRKKAPKVYNLMLVGIATDMCGRMRDGQERMKKMWKEMERH